MIQSRPSFLFTGSEEKKEKKEIFSIVNPNYYLVRKITNDESADKQKMEAEPFVFQFISWISRCQNR